MGDDGQSFLDLPEEEDIRLALDALIRSVEDPAQPASSFDELAVLIGEYAGIDPHRVYAVWVSKPGNLRVRMTQSKRARAAELGVAVLKNAEDVEATARASEKLLTEDSFPGSVLICAQPTNEPWTIAAIVERSTEALEARFLDDFHQAIVKKVEVEEPVPPGEAQTSDDLAQLVAEWRRLSGYPTEHDKKQIAARDDLRELLTQENLQAAAEHPEVFDLARFRRLASGSYGGAGNQAQINRFLTGGGAAIAQLARTIEHLLYAPGSEAERIDSVLTDPKWRVHGFSEALATKCLAITDPGRWIPLFVYRGPKGKRAIMQSQELPVDVPDEAGKSQGELAVESNDRLKELLEPYLPGDPWGQMSFLWWVLQRRRAGEDGVSTAAADIGSLANELLLDEEWLQTVVELLEDKRQVIFYGPPGTGKTYVARALARHLAPVVTNRMTVQFHPSYSYEDFIEGYRPLGGGETGSVWYEVLPGPLKRLAEEADSTTDDCVLVIDEINRGNIAKIFGELYYLLEYRDDEVQLQYGDEPFTMPENLYMIGTMNTADRSIALLDAALRRRFHFVEFFPDRPPLEGLLRRWLTAHGLTNMLYVADVVDLANGLLPDRNLQIGPSYFMRPGLDREWFERIWRYSVMPYVEEHFFDEPERVDDFALDRLETQLRGTPQPSAEGGEADDEQTAPETPGVGTDGD